jgi:GAF domain-containing protein/CheY-like chemotaxis protein
VAAILTIVGGVIAVLVVRRRSARPPALDREHAGRAHLAALLDINTKIGALAPTDALLTFIGNEAARLLGVDNAGFRLLEGDELVLAGAIGNAAETMTTARIRVGESLSGKVVEEKRTICADFATSSDIFPENAVAALSRGYTTFLGVPLRVGDRVIGVLSFRSRRAFSAEDQELAEAFAGQAAVAIEHARLYHEATRQAHRMQALADLGRLLAQTLDPELVARQVVDSTQTLFRAAVSILFRLDESTGDVVSMAVAGDPGPIPDGALVIAAGTGLAGLALRERTPVTTRDVRIDPRIVLTPEMRARIEQSDYRSGIAVPLVVRERAIGALVIGTDPDHVFDAEELSLAQAFASEAAVALDNAHLFAEATRRGREASELAALAGSLTESLRVEEVSERIVAALVPLFHARSINIRLLTPAGSLVLVARGGRPSAMSPRGSVLPPGYGITGRVVATGRPLWTRNVAEEPEVLLPDSLRDDVVSSGDHAFIAVPMRAKGRIIGAIALSDRLGREFTAADAGLLQTFADQAALALENAGLYEETERRRRETEVVAEVAGSINASLDLATVLQRVTVGARDLCGSDMARILLREPGSDAVVARAAAGQRSAAMDTLRIEPGKGVGGVVLATGKPFRTASYFEDPRVEKSYTGVVRDEGIVATMAVPIVIDGRVEGLLFVDNRTPRGFADQDEAILARLADHAAVAIRNARLYRETSEYAERLQALDEVNRLVSSSLNPDEVLRNIVAAAARFLDAPWVTMWIVDEARRRITRSFVLGDEGRAETLPVEFAMGEGAVGWVAEHREPIFWTGVPDPRLPDGIAERLRAFGIGFRLVYPIALGERVVGVLTANRTTTITMTPETEALLRSFASQAALALEHARLFSETARRLEETRALLDVAEILNSTLDGKQLLKRAAIRIAQVCQVDRCSIERWEGGRVVPLTSQYADGQPRPEQWRQFSTQPPWTPRQVPAHLRAIETRRPVVIQDASDTDLIPHEWVEWFGIKSYMVVPLVRQDQVIGVVSLDYNERVGTFADWQIDLAMTIAGQLALSLENLRLYVEVEDRLRETQALLAVAEALSQPGTPDVVMRRVAREIGRATKADMVGVYFMNEKKDALVALAGYHVPHDMVAIFRERPMRLATFPFFADSLSMGRAMWSADPLHDPRFDPGWLEGLPPHAVLFVPTLAQGQPMGGLFLVWWQPGRPFPAAEIPLVEGVATQIGLALENAELSRRTRIKLRETEALLTVSRALASTLDLEAMLRQFMREAARTLGADTVAFWSVSDDGEWLEPFVGYHVPPKELDRFRTLRVSMVKDAFYADAVRRKRPALSVLGQDDPALPEPMRALAHKSQLFVPIIAKERLIGALAAVWWETSRELSESELTLVEALASQAGVAVENARLFTENRRQVQELSVLYDLARAVTGELDRAALVEAVHAHLARVMDVSNMLVLIRDQDANNIDVALRILHGERNDALPTRYPLHGIGLMQFVLSDGIALRTEDYGGECARRGVAPVSYGPAFRHWMGVPMKAGDHVLGALALCTNVRAYTDADERLLGNVADLAALALRSARLYEERARAFGELSSAQDQLVRTEKLRALGEMASGVAHDFNNLLASILGRSQLLLQRVEEPRLRKWLQVIERAALDGAQTVRRLQEFTRIRRDQPFVSVDLNQVVRDALEITQSRWRDEPSSRGITIDVRTSLDEISPVGGDPVELREALTNLILNAIDAMPDGGVLSLRTAVVDDGLIELSVGDTGVGMPESVRQRIFDPFFTTKGAQGTGLGLSITYGILMRHRARVAVESEPGAGTTFRLAFEPSVALGIAEPVAAIPAPSGAPLRCLVVDDEESVGTVLGDVLEMSGHSVAVLTSGADAIERFRSEPFDVVFTDLAMPGLSGWQVARAAKSIAPDVPVFLVTGFGVELSAEERRAHGVDLVLSKPLNIQSILDAIAFAATHRGH